MSIQRRGRRIYTANATPPAPLAATPGTRQPESRGGPGTRHFGPTGAAIRLRPETALGGGDAIRAAEPTFSRRRSPITYSPPPQTLLTFALVFRTLARIVLSPVAALSVS